LKSRSPPANVFLAKITPQGKHATPKTIGIYHAAEKNDDSWWRCGGLSKEKSTQTAK